jgi:hypothetical protein
MIAMASPSLWSPRGAIGVLVARSRALTRFGLALLALAVVATAAEAIDPRALAGVSIWAKPTKFFVSIGVFALSAAWTMGYVRPDRRHSPPMRAATAMLIAAGTLELVYIVWRASRAEASHFNIGTPGAAAMYSLMGLFAVLLVGTTLPLAWEIARRPVAGALPEFVAAIVVGLVLCFALGGGVGGYMSAQPGHAVGAEGGHLPLFGWNRAGGDLRVAHFFGIHAQQAIPLMVAAVGAAGLSTRNRWRVLAVGGVLYTLLTLLLLRQALAGRAPWLS